MIQARLVGKTFSKYDEINLSDTIFFAPAEKGQGNIASLKTGKKAPLEAGYGPKYFNYILLVLI